MEEDWGTTSSVRVGTGPNQESVWDYPRPPVLVPDERKVEIYARNGDLLASTLGSMRVETASPPTFYIPAKDLSQELTPLEGSSFCEWKGASYFSYEGVGFGATITPLIASGL